LRSGRQVKSASIKPTVPFFLCLWTMRFLPLYMTRVPVSGRVVQATGALFGVGVALILILFLLTLNLTGGATGALFLLASLFVFAHGSLFVLVDGTASNGAPFVLAD